MDKRHSMSGINIAPHAQSSRPLDWVLLCAGAALCIAGALSLIAGVEQYRAVNTRIEDQAIRVAEARKEQVKKARTQEATQAGKSTKELQRVKELAGLSWNGLFEALEVTAKSARGGVSIVSMVPSQAQAQSTQIAITALASSSQVMLFYMDELKKDKHIERVELTSQQPEENVSPSAIRFQINASWNPATAMRETGTESLRTSTTTKAGKR